MNQPNRDLRTIAQQAKEIVEYLSGRTDSPPPGVPLPPQSLLWGVWWGVLLTLVFVFCGQSSKFIYIDF